VLENINLDIDKGESVVIIGRSGGGKSVLLKHLVALLKPDRGRVLIDGEDIVPLNERQLLRVRHKFGMLFQSAALFDSLTVAENIGFPFRRECQLSPAEVGRKVARILDLVDLSGTENKKPSELSGGMRKRVGLARAIVYQPEIVLYDEPTTGLDPIVSDSIDKLILRVRDHLRVTTVVVTHDMRSARRLGQRILMLHDQSIYVAGTSEEIFGSADPVVRQFVEGISDLKELHLH
jgi:phospholipid/cholesterol/gamma-HCH transport system ATP-binding protein